VIASSAPNVLVEQQYRFLGEQRAQERDALAHAAGELRWQQPLGAREAEPFKERQSAATRLAARQAGVLECEPRVVECAPPWQQAVALRHQRAEPEAVVRCACIAD
jgi:hypothetical protein